jgi:predicted small secreted protein
MTIKISNNAITFGNFTLTPNTQGFTFNGKIRAKRGFVDNKTPGVQGKISGYAAGGYSPSITDVIQKFPFAADANATDVANLTQARQESSSASSKTHGYVTGGNLNPGLVDTIEKFQYALDVDASDVGNLIATSKNHTGSSSDTHGYAQCTPDPTSPSGNIQKFPFATDTNATDVADLTQERVLAAGSSSRTHGYTSGGWSPERNTIDKYPFAVDANAGDVGDLSRTLRQVAGGQSSVNGYVMGGSYGHPGAGTKVDRIHKFPFATDTNASDIANLTGTRHFASGQSSLTDQYTSGGNDPSSQTNVIDKIPFTTDVNATDVGDLIAAVASSVGAQN